MPPLSSVSSAWSWRDVHGFYVVWDVLYSSQANREHEHPAYPGKAPVAVCLPPWHERNKKAAARAKAEENAWELKCGLGFVFDYLIYL